MRIKIALVQFEIVPGAPQENLRKAERVIAEAAAGADLIVFPEIFLTGSLPNERQIIDREGRFLRHFQQLAVQHSIEIVPGSLIEGDERGIYNTAYYIDAGGSVRGSHRKVNLWLPERGAITAGSRVEVCETRFGRVGLLICWDLMFPEMFRALLRQGVELVICPSYWCYEDAGAGRRYNPEAETTLIDALCVSRAFENEIALVYVNAAGRATSSGREETLIGHSQITLPFLGAARTLRHNHEELAIQEIETEVLAVAEQAYEIRSDLKAGRPQIL